MGFARLSTLLLAAVLDSPALWHAFVVHDLDYMSAMTRYLVAVVVAAVMLALLRWLAHGYQRAAAAAAVKPAEPAHAARRRTDTEVSDEAAAA